MNRPLFLVTLFAVAAITCLAPEAGAATSHRGVSSARAERPSASSKSGDLGLGIMFGEPSGLTVKYWTGHENAFDAAFTYSASNFIEVLGDYLWHFPQVVASATAGRAGTEFNPYAGVGGLLYIGTSGSGQRYGFFHMGSGDEVGAGIRIPLGIEWLPHKAPLGVFGEFVPGLGIIPGMFGFIQGDIGARFYL